MNSRLFILILVLLVDLLTSVKPSTTDDEELIDNCDHTFQKPTGFFRRHVNVPFLKKFFTHWIPFTDKEHVKMQFFLYKRDFPECGKELKTYDDEALAESGFNAEHPTRVIIHGWMSQSKGKLNRRIKNAYLALASRNVAEPHAERVDNCQAPTSNATDFNVILVDWSVISTNVNYYEVVEFINPLGFLLSEFLRYLHTRASLQFKDLYLIGHSLGAQIAGSVGMQVKPLRINTIYALDPAGPKFRNAPPDERIDPTDAVYVESIQTSSSLGLQEPVGHAAFYPNFGRDQQNCYKYGCSHSRSHKFFAESIISTDGFYGSRCEREADGTFTLTDLKYQYRMGGEPSIPKNGTFYVQTRAESPFAMGCLNRLVMTA